ncbi:hypothetical protein CYMTET_12462 [Cymbomonas tetramitiformis]|uniref:Uncharacterized protein n=1 Tax=Cymbomonas tetramitiformis TaxID=36881 RepID=A0AAE0LC16_9CHLO|nr:hypothetical protein CYMTET_12462 [Cymbomonas tetramitiformis]
MCCLQTAHLQVKGAPGTAKYKMHIDLDPTPWLGRQYTEYERALLEGCPPRCRKFNRVQVGTMKFRTASMDKKFKTVQCYFRSFYVERVRTKGRERTKEKAKTDRFGRVDDIYRVELGGRPYVFVKVSWLKKPTKALTAALRARHSIIGAESVSKCFYVLDPENPATEFDRKEPFVLAEEIASQVVIRKHPCMETSVVLDPLADFFEQIVRDENPSDDEA